jgi:hypothetical protein
VPERGVLGAAVTTQLAPTRGDLVELARRHALRRRHHLGEIVEVASPIPVAHSQEEILLSGEVFVDRTFRVPGGMRDVIESRCGETLFGENIFSSIEQERPRVFEPPLT